MYKHVETTLHSNSGWGTVVTHSAGAVIASKVFICGVCIDEACSKLNRLTRQIFPHGPVGTLFWGSCGLAISLDAR